MKDRWEMFRDGVIKAYKHASYKGYTNKASKVDMPSHNEWYEAGVAYGSMCIARGDYPVFEDFDAEERNEAMRGWVDDG